MELASAKVAVSGKVLLQLGRGGHIVEKLLAVRV